MLPAESQERGKGYEGGACDRVIWIILDLLKHIELESLNQSERTQGPQLARKR